MRNRFVLGFVVAAVTLLGAAPPANACINGSRFSREEAVREVARAEKMIAAGRYRQALRLLESHDLVYHRLRGHDPILKEHATLLIVTAKLRQTRDETAIGYALAYLQRRPDQDDPVVIARIAEAKSRISGEANHDEALVALEDLEQRDLVPDPEAYAALVRLRVETDDLDGAGRAYAACRKMTKRAKVCGPKVAAR